MKSVWLELGRRDAHPHHAAFDLAGVREDDVDERAVVARRGLENERGRERRVRELQVHESWLRIVVKPTGLRCVRSTLRRVLLSECTTDVGTCGVRADPSSTTTSTCPSSSSPSPSSFSASPLSPLSPSGPGGSPRPALHTRLSSASSTLADARTSSQGHQSEEDVKPLLTPSEVTTEGQDEEQRGRKMRLGWGGEELE